MSGGWITHVLIVNFRTQAISRMDAIICSQSHVCQDSCVGVLVPVPVSVRVLVLVLVLAQAQVYVLVLALLVVLSTDHSLWLCADMRYLDPSNPWILGISRPSDPQIGRIWSRLVDIGPDGSSLV